MTLTELQEKLNLIRSGLTPLDTLIRHRFDDDDADDTEGRFYLSEQQVELVQDLFDLFRSLNFGLAFSGYKSLTKEPFEPIDQRQCGTPVKVRSCVDGHGDDTHFGILLGEAPQSMMHRIDAEGNVTASMSMYNPAIYVPALKAVVYGCQSWWAIINDEAELATLITKESISEVWYMKYLLQTAQPPAPSPQESDNPEGVAS